MILYLGTSSLIKLYVEEPHSNAVRQWVRDAEIVATCKVAHTETVSALDSCYQDKQLSKQEYERIIRAFSEDWPSFASVDFDEVRAGQLIKKYGLRRFDAMHLSAAKMICGERPSLSFGFSSFDPKLCEAAAAEGMRVLTIT